MLRMATGQSSRDGKSGRTYGKREFRHARASKGLLYPRERGGPPTPHPRRSLALGKLAPSTRNGLRGGPRVVFDGDDEPDDLCVGEEEQGDDRHIQKAADQDQNARPDGTPRGGHGVDSPDHDGDAANDRHDEGEHANDRRNRSQGTVALLVLGG